MPIALHEKNLLKSQPNTDTASKLDYLNAIKTQLKKNIHLLKNYHTKTKQSQKILLDSIQEFFLESKFNTTNYGSKHGFLDACYVKLVLHLFEDCEILSDVVTLEWYEKQKGSLLQAANSSKLDSENKRYSIKKLEPFMKWLEESDDDDDQDED